MTTITLIDNDKATLVYHVEKKIIHHCFHKTVIGDDLKKVLIAGTEAFEQFGANKWLSDDRLNSGIPQEDMDWGNTVWFPRIMKAGWKYWALIVPQEFAARISLATLVQQWAEQGLRVMVFSEPERALAWLEAQ